MLYDPMNCMVDIWYFQECDKIPHRKPRKDKKSPDKCENIDVKGIADGGESNLVDDASLE